MKKTWIVVGLTCAIAFAAGAPALAADAVDGKGLYDKKCAMCHGKDGVAGKMGAGSANFNDPKFQEANTAEKIAELTKAGVPDTKMMAFADKMTDAEIKAVAEYIKTLK
jgi:mono/diheme cytochrome c family protein